MKTLKNPIRIPLKNKFFASALEITLGLSPLIKLYDQWLQKTKDNRAISVQFLEHTLGTLQVNLSIKQKDNLDAIPRTGPIMFLANHPYGGIEGMQLAQLLLQHRPDLKVLTNEMLSLIPEFKDLFVGVDVLSKNSVQKNISGIKTISKHLKAGGAVLMFPAGTVSSFSLKKMKVIEQPWSSIAGRLTQRYKASCITFHVHGHNGFLFNFVGLIHKRLRTALLARELSNKTGRTITITAGKIIQARELSFFKDESLVTDFLKLNSEVLQPRHDATQSQAPVFNALIEESFSNDELTNHLQTLTSYRLLSLGAYSVYCVPYEQMGPMMRALAIIREKTFRAAGEGTGQAIDSDQYDPHYLHLFVWDNERSDLVGAYRMGRCDEIIQQQGIKGLYSRSLFYYDASYIEKIGGALEVGRSFVNLNYQRNPRALDMLWRGIGTFVASNPQYHTLFGCVSISSEHSVMARAFLSETMIECFPAKAEFLDDIRPISPLRIKGKVWTSKLIKSFADIAIINKLLGNFDNGRSVPILLRHYLALNGRFVSFSVNHGFNQALDGLILVDLRNSPMKYLNRYLGLKGAEGFLNKWKKDESAA